MIYNEVIKMIERHGFMEHNIGSDGIRYILPGSDRWFVSINAGIISQYEIPVICLQKKLDSTDELRIYFFGIKSFCIKNLDCDNLNELLQDLKDKFHAEMYNYKQKLKAERIKQIREL